MFHIQKRIRDAVKNSEYLRKMSEIVKTDKPKEIFNIIYNYKVELESDKKYDELAKVKELEIYLKNNELEDLLIGELEKKLENEINTRIPQAKKIKKKNIGKIRNVTRRIISDNLSDFSKLKLKDIIKERSFNEMRLIGD